MAGVWGVADHVRLHFGLLVPASSWCSVLATGETVASAHSSSLVLPHRFFQHMGSLHPDGH